MADSVSKSVLKRLPVYLTYLRSLGDDAPENISATVLASALNMGEVQVRKDLALVSDGGRPKVGYRRRALAEDIERFLGYDNTNDAVLIGAGKLGRALLGYTGFSEYGLNIVAAFDANPAQVGVEENGKPVLPLSALEELLPPGIFVRCQRSFLVNLCHAAQAAGGELILSDGTRLPLGRKVRDRVIEAYEAVRSARTGGGPRSKGAYENDFCCDL